MLQYDQGLLESFQTNCGDLQHRILTEDIESSHVNLDDDTEMDLQVSNIEVVSNVEVSRPGSTVTEILSQLSQVNQKDGFSALIDENDRIEPSIEGENKEKSKIEKEMIESPGRDQIDKSTREETNA